MKNKYTFGDITFEIDPPFETEADDPCEVFRSNHDTDYLIRIAPCDKTGNEGPRTERRGNIITRYTENGHIAKLSVPALLTSSEAAFIFLERDAFILHASYIVLNGKAILFTAPSGTGKSTQARFWHDERGAEIINGDRVLVTRRNGIFYANGIYASGTSGISQNRTAPIQAVVLLEQGESNEQNHIPSRMLFLRILCECSYNIKDIGQCKMITQLVSDMVNSVHTLCYCCKKSPDAVEALERILWKKE